MVDGPAGLCTGGGARHVGGRGYVLTDDCFAVFGGADASGTITSLCEARPSMRKVRAGMPYHPCTSRGTGLHLWQSAGASLLPAVQARLQPKCTRKGSGSGDGFRAACSRVASFTRWAA